MIRNFLGKLFLALFILALAIKLFGQVAVVQSPVPKFRDFLANGSPNAGGCVYTFTTATSNPLATYTDSTGVTPNSNPVQLDANGEAFIWITSAVYRIQVWTFGGITPLGSNCGGGSQRYQVDGISDKGLISGSGGSLQLVPGGHANQTVVGPITADQFTGPATQLLTTFSIPSRPSETYNIPTSGTTGGSVVINPSGSGGTTNVLDCTLSGITCKRTAQYFFKGAQCNNATPGVGWDTFPTQSPSALCQTGTNVQKGLMGMPAAITHIQQNTGTNTGANTVTTTYPAALIGGTGDYMILSIAFNGTTTATGCTDGTNAFVQQKHVTNGALSVDIWAMASPATKPAGTTLTCTFTTTVSSALKWHEYFGPNAVSADVTASATGTSTTVSTGTTASLAQASELAFAAMGTLTVNSAVVATSGYTDHGVLNTAATLQGDDAGIIAQTTAGQNATFTLGSSTAWAGAIVTFKAAVSGPAIAQQTVALPAFFNSAQAINAIAKWTVLAAPVGTSNAVLAMAIVCTADGATDDPTFNADTQVTAAITTTGPNLPTNTNFNGLAAGACAAGQTLHLQFRRMRYNASDTYEGYIGLIGAQLQVGVTQ